MNREIKFRMWKDGEMLQLHEMHTDEQNNCDFQESEKIGVLMQYTGLKDKNGAEIYEGDILGLSDEYRINSDGTEDKSRKSVEFIDGGFRGVYFSDNKKSVVGLIDKTDLKMFEVIGNIHQNPELLK